jgi:hypothetical protein
MVARYQHHVMRTLSMQAYESKGSVLTWVPRENVEPIATESCNLGPTARYVVLRAKSNSVTVSRYLGPTAHRVYRNEWYIVL